MMIKFESIYMNNAMEENIKFMKMSKQISESEASLYNNAEEGFPVEILKKITFLGIKAQMDDVSNEDIEVFKNDLDKLLDITKLSRFNLRNKSKDPMKMDLAFLDKISANVEMLSLEGIDLSSLNKEKIERFKDLKFLTLCNGNIYNLEILENLNSCIGISLEDNPIADYNYLKESGNLQKTAQLIKKHVENLFFTDDCLDDIVEAVKHKKISLDRCLECIELINLLKIDGLNIVMAEKDFDVDNSIIKSKISQASQIKNAVLNLDIEKYKLLKEKTDSTMPIEIIIKNASELSIEELEESPNIKTVVIEDEENAFEHTRYGQYERNEYKHIREAIDNIINELPKGTQKKVFAHIYKILASNISYDEYAASKEGEKFSGLQVTCRNLYGGLVEGRTVCIGYADILRNTLSCADIECKSIGGRKYSARKKMEIGHVWNQVKLNGEWFNTDLTWDRNDVRTKKNLMYFLKSDKDFEHTEFRIATGSIPEECDRSVSYDEQKSLLSDITLEDRRRDGER